MILILSAPPVVQAEENNWLKTARIAGLGLYETLKDVDLETMLDNLVRQHVNVIECDTSLSDYLDDKGFRRQVEFIKKVTSRAHEKGLKVVWYYPTLESITPAGEKKPTSMQKDHPDWVQRNFDRRTYNYFYGSKVFWVELNDESAWLCPNSPYKEYYYNRVKQLAATGLDGLWFDVPLFNSIAGEWTCTCEYCQEKFKTETGMAFPKALNFKDPSFFRWIVWRHETIADFLAGIQNTIKTIDPEMEVIIEVVSIDHLINTREGLDVTFFNPDLHVVWEVDAISDTTSMKDARVEDWLCMFTAYTYCKGISKTRAHWAFSYGFREDDAQMVMASALAAQCNPYETRIPRMCTTIGENYRGKMFGWIKNNSDYIFQSVSGADTAILYSPHTRDLIDGHRNGGFYISDGRPNPSYRWWLEDPEMSLPRSRYLSEYRGWAIMYIKQHIPFDIHAVNQVTLEELSAYKTVILPGAACLSRAQRDLLLDFAARGGKLIVTGEESGTYNLSGKKLDTGLWHSFTGGTEKADSDTPGNIVFIKDHPGKEFIKRLVREQNPPPHPMLQTEDIQSWIKDQPEIYIQAYELGDKVICHLVHYGWTRNKDKAPFSQTATLSIPRDAKKKIKQIRWSSPETKDFADLPFTQKGNRVECDIEVFINALVVIEPE
jgi:hypothetical protein